MQIKKLVLKLSSVCRNQEELFYQLEIEGFSFLISILMELCMLLISSLDCVNKLEFKVRIGRYHGMVLKQWLWVLVGWQSLMRNKLKYLIFVAMKLDPLVLIGKL